MNKCILVLTLINNICDKIGDKWNEEKAMPEIFTKDQKFNVIEYGENCSSFPLWDKLKLKLHNFLKK